MTATPSNNNDPLRPTVDSRVSYSSTPTMAAQGSLLRRPRPSQVQTSHPSSTQPGSMPTSAVSASTAASGSSQHDSPIMSPEHAVLTNTSSSIQPSPEPYRGQGHDPEQFPPPPPFHLGDPLLAYKASSNGSANPSIVATAGSSMAEALSNSHSSGKGLIRRLSNRASKFASRTRRQSAATPMSREGSVGPGIIRRRSDSTNTAPAAESVLLTDSDDEFHDEMNELGSIFGAESMVRDFSSGSAAPSLAGSASFADVPTGPVVPMALVKGTYLDKISKKKRKRMLFILQADAGRVTWEKGRSTKCIYIDNIKEVRIGSDIRQYRIDYGVPESDEGRFFTIFYAVPEKSRSKTMHLVAGDEETFAHWVNALDSISKHREVHMASLMAFNDSAIRGYWNGEMTKQFENRQHSSDREVMDFSAVERVCRNLHIHMGQRELRAKFGIADTTRSGRLNFSEFQIFVREMKRREDIRQLYLKLASDAERGITWADFVRFLRDEQCEDVDSSSNLWESRFVRYAHRGGKSRSETGSFQRYDKDSVTMNEQALAIYLTSKDNYPLVRSPPEYSLDRPFNEYFISSSHNTYLVGRQIADIASIEGYISTLVRGCRSVEIDCWNGSDGQPIVKHGYAMTNAISFREVINTVNKYAFVASRFPLWVSLEVHCNPTQQEVMADIMREIFGARLVTEPLDPSSSTLPSPSELKDRILIKVKGTHQTHEPARNSGESTGRRRGNSLTSPFSKPVPSDNTPVPAQFLSSPLLGPTSQPRRGAITKRVDTINEGEVHDTVSSSTSECDSEEEKRGKRKTSKIVKSLGELGVYCSGVKFHGFESAECKKSNHILSFMEGTFRKHSKASDSKLALTRHNMRYMMRVYPQYSRLSSDNFNPLMYWRRGVQMAALNWQTFDLGMQLNQAMFDGGTDQSGYVLKPASMREIRVLHGGLPLEAIGKVERQKISFDINIISAQQLIRPSSLPPNRTLDPYVEVEIFHTNDKRDKHDSMAGIPILTDTPLKSSTGIVKENGFNPIFNHMAHFNVTTKHPELVFVRFSVKLSPDGETSGRNATIATYTAKLSSLKQGYRTLPLLDSNGDQYLFSTLFCHIKVDPTTSVYVPRAGESNGGEATVGKLKNIGRNVFNRSSANSTKSSFDKSSVDGGYSDSQQPMV